MTKVFLVLAIILATEAFSQSIKIGMLHASNPGQQLDYYRTVGFSHVWFYALGTSTSQAERRSHLQYHRNEILTLRGMQPIPYVASLSHLSGGILANTSLIAASGGHLAVPGDSADNPGAWTDFNAMLQDIKATFPVNPEFVIIGHDELIAANGYALSSWPNAIHEVAEEIATRVRQVNALLGTAVKIILWGDSFLPNDNGQTLGFQGDSNTGAGGVLDVLTRSTASGGFGVSKSRIVIAPWGYGTEYRNYVRPTPSYPLFDKLAQIRYLNNMGIDFMVVTGESPVSVATREEFSHHVQTFYEWIYAVNRVNSPRFLGYLAHNYVNFNTGGSGAMAGISAGYIIPLVDYASRHRTLFNRPFNASFFRNCDYVNSRNSLTWNSSFYGTPPALHIDQGNDYDGDGISDLSVKTTAGQWLIDEAANGFGSWDRTIVGTGNGTAEPVPADFDGDGRIDLSVKTTDGYWHIDYARNGFGVWDLSLFGYGDVNAEAVPADYNGDGATDLAVKTTDGRWLIDYAVPGTSNNGFGSYNLSISGVGDANAKAVPADYNGDGLADLSVKTTDGRWLIDYAVPGSANNGYGSWNLSLSGCGNTEATPVPADYNGDGLADLSVKTTDGRWLVDYAVQGSANNGFGSWNLTVPGCGDVNAKPVPADYNGDGIADLSVKTTTGAWLIDMSVRGAANNGFGSWNTSLSGYGGSTAVPVSK